MDEDSKIIAKMLTNQVSNLNKEHNDKRDVPIDEELFKGMYCFYKSSFLCLTDLCFKIRLIFIICEIYLYKCY